MPKSILPLELATKHYVAATTTAVRALRALHSGSARTIFVRKHGDAHPAPNPTGLWGFLVKTLARFTTEKTIKTLAMRAIRFCSSCRRRAGEAGGSAG